MKQKALALVLALVMAAGLLPLPALAAEPQRLPEPVLAPAALPELPMPQASTHSITMTVSGSGKAELYTSHAGTRESVCFLADPAPGYKVSFEKCGYYMSHYQMELYYLGGCVYEIIMPDGDVMLNLEFVKIPSSAHNVKLTVGQGGTAAVNQKTAKKGESVFVDITPTAGYSLNSVRARSGGQWLEGLYLGTTDREAHYEVFMSDADVEILVDFVRNGPYTVTSHVDAAGGTIQLSHKTAYEAEKVTVTAKPNRGYRVASISGKYSKLSKVKENVWTFSMPKSKEEIHVRFEPIPYAVSVTTEVPMGGTASLNAKTATIGQTVKLTCRPDAGYRVAQITGATLKNLGSNTYSFVMSDAPVRLSVLFLRTENPFLDVNETHFFYDPVLWAVEKGITNGVDATHFGPMNACNRAQVVTLLWRAAGSPAPKSTANPFKDVPRNSWYTNAVLWAVENGITNGLSANTFGPDTICNRAQVVTFLHRAGGSRKPLLTKNPFTDVPAGSWFEQAVLWALESGVTAGATASTFNPAGQSLRGQVVTFLHRADSVPSAPLPFPDLG